MVFITGMSGTGKSSALAELARRGHRVVDTDFGGWIEGEPEPLWREDRIRELLDEHKDETLFVSGWVANQGAFYDCFDFWTPQRGLAFSDPVDRRVPGLRVTDGRPWQDIGERRPRANLRHRTRHDRRMARRDRRVRSLRAAAGRVERGRHRRRPRR